MKENIDNPNPNSAPVFKNAVKMAIKTAIFIVAIYFLIAVYLINFSPPPDKPDVYGSQNPFLLLFVLGAYAISLLQILILAAFLGDILLSKLIYHYYENDIVSSTAAGAMIGGLLGFFSIIVSVALPASFGGDPLSFRTLSIASAFAFIAAFAGGWEGSKICIQDMKKRLQNTNTIIDSKL